ncbi:unnamed protein product [Cylicostephanus goldi]|uniref:ZP domain-containing protein n=1 Tax=Cylicostephanus goldi TaxID=71465 RepID=A0A3P6RDK8_CYLGO|nr:unnamed protein product [Cylicostephanus goldi]
MCSLRCSLDESILPHPTYDLQKGLVYTPSKAFRFTKSRRVHFNCMLSVCHKNDEDCMREIPPRCSRIRKRQLSSSEISVEERLEQIRAQMNAMNNLSNNLGFDELIFEDSEVRGSENVVSRPLLINDEDEFEQQGFSPQPCLPSNYVHWIYALLITNVLSILVAVLACSNLLKNYFAIDIVTTRHKYRCAT